MTANWRVESVDPQGIGRRRLAIGLGQGLLFYALFEAAKHKAWPSTDHVLFAGIGGAAFFGPIIWLAGLGSLRRWTLLLWLPIATALAAGLSGYEVWRKADETAQAFASPGWTWAFPTFLATSAALFIGHHLVAAADEARKPIAPYRLYFDTGWKHAVQIALSFAFLGAFWLVLELGAALFFLIGLKAFQATIFQPWFFLPVSGVVFAAGVHLTDVRATITRGLRAIGLMLLSWLMPLMGLLTAAFLAALPFTGLSALWKLGHATALLLSASAALIILLNATYQDGGDETRAPKVLRWLGRLTAIVLLPMAALASVGLWQRIVQHGLTSDRIVACGCLVAAVCYAVGYVIAAVRPGSWLKGLEATNVAVAFVDLAIILALFTPVADPGRISVADQTARLVTGRIAPDAFDYRFLRFGAGRWGRDALKRLAQGGNNGLRAAEIAKRAREALQSQNPWAPSPATPRPSLPPQSPPAPLSERIVMHPAGARLPDTFAAQDASKPSWFPIAQCTPDKRCDGYLLDLGPQDRSDLVIGVPPARLIVYRQDEDGTWKQRGNVFAFGCGEAFSNDLHKGDVRTVAPEVSDLEIGGRPYRINLTASPLCGSSRPGAPVLAPPVRAHR